MTSQEIACGILTLFDGKPERWTQGACARTAEARTIGPLETPARAWCIYGALVRVTGDYGLGDTAAFRDLVSALVGCHDNAWNDHPDRTFEDVTRLLGWIATGAVP
jgi:hypothetical protein